jgi:uncharacterized protein
VVHPARTWCRPALAGDPSVLLALVVPDDEVVHRDDVGADLVANAPRFFRTSAEGCASSTR